MWLQFIIFLCRETLRDCPSILKCDYEASVPQNTNQIQRVTQRMHADQVPALEWAYSLEAGISLLEPVVC